jgi:hypothetical protein
MGDCYQVVVDCEVPLEEVEEAAASICAWLIQDDVILPTPTDCVPGDEGGYPPGRNCERVTEGSCADLASLRTNGLRILRGRTIFYSVGADIVCSHCGDRTSEGEEFGRALRAWADGDDGATFSCPACGHKKLIAECSFDPPWGFGNLGFKFWNWPPLKDSFVRELSTRLGHRTVFVCGKL